MKTAVYGPRTIQNFEIVNHALTTASSTFNTPITAVFSTMTSGVPIFAYRWGRERKLPVRAFPVDWKGLGKPAALIALREMISYADALVVVSDGQDWMCDAAVKYAKGCDPRVVVFMEVVKTGNNQTLVEYGREQV